MNRPFAESFLNRNDHVVLRRRLLPLSLWHLLNLEIAKNPFFIGGSFPQVKDLRIAVTICTTTFPKLPDFSTIRLTFDWMRSFRCNFLTETTKFRAYLNDFNAMPQIWQKQNPSIENNNKSSNIPWALAIVSSVCGSTGWSAQEVWNMPVGQAYWYHVAFCIQKGWNVNLVSDGELEAIERFNARRNRK